MALKLEKSEWREYFDRVSKVLGAKLVEVDVTALKLGDQVEVEWLPLIGLTYDPKDDVMAVAMEGIEHNISHPKEIYVEQDVETLRNVEVVDPSGEHHIVILKDPLRLAAA